MMTSPQTVIEFGARDLPSARTTVLSAALAMLFGTLLVYGVGFASPIAVHNAAHDARHSFAFPCH